MYIPKSAKLTLIANRAIGAILMLLVVSMPALLRWYALQRPLDHAAATAIAVGFYICCFPVSAALWNLDRILRNILDARVFVRENVEMIRRIRWHCMATGLICLPASFFYPPLIFVVVIMGFLSLVVSVLGSIMHTAVEIWEENALTI